MIVLLLTVFYLIFILGGTTTSKDYEVLKSWAEKQSTNSCLHVAICVVPTITCGFRGVIEGPKATCFSSFVKQLSSPVTAIELKVDWNSEVVTTCGLGATMKYFADEVARFLLIHFNQGEGYLIRDVISRQWAFANYPNILVHHDEVVKFSHYSIMLLYGICKAQAFVASGKMMEITNGDILSVTIQFILPYDLSDLLNGNNIHWSHDILVMIIVVVLCFGVTLLMWVYEPGDDTLALTHH